MRQLVVPRAALVLTLLIGVHGLKPAFADGNINNVNHVIVLMQAGHSFDNYFGALAYAPGSPYHNGNGSCDPADHACVDGLTCAVNGSGNLSCSNQNAHVDGSIVSSYHGSQRCATPAVDPSWYFTHLELNFRHPERTWHPHNNGFLMAESITQLGGSSVQNAVGDPAMAFYNQGDLPFYYDLAQKFSIGDGYFASVAGPSFPNRSYLLAGTSFGHLTTNERFPPPGGYKPITGTIFDLLSANGVSWANYFQDVPQGSSFLGFSESSVDPHFMPLSTFLEQAAGAAAGTLPQVSFVDPNFGLTDPASENDERAPTDIRRGQAFVSQVVNAVRNGPYWSHSVILIMYDQHGGFYDHVAPPPAAQGSLPNPDGIPPGQCADLSNSPQSQQPGWGAECWQNPVAASDTSLREGETLCPMLGNDPAGPYPDGCANFDQLGVRVPLLTVSPFSKPHYVSHVTGDHTSILAFIERRFLGPGTLGPAYLTARDQNADGLLDLFDFDNSPSVSTVVTQASLPGSDCTPVAMIAPKQHQVLLSWAGNTSAISAYAVYRSSTSGGPYTKINSVPSTTPSYIDATVLSGQTYYYVVTSVDAKGDESTYSSEVTAVIPTP